MLVSIVDHFNVNTFHLYFYCKTKVILWRKFSKAQTKNLLSKKKIHLKNPNNQLINYNTHRK